MNLYTLAVIWTFSLNFHVSLEDGVIYLQLVKYTHSGIASNGNACESFGLGSWGDKCDPYFKIVLSHKSNFPLVVWQSSIYDNLEGTHYFGSVFGQLPNPLKYNFKGGLSQFMIHVKIDIFDADTTLLDDHIITFNKLVVVPIATNGRVVQENDRVLIDQKSEHVSLSYRLWITCDEHFYHDCSKRCHPMDSMDDGHFFCDRFTGERLCMPGWRFPPRCLTIDLCEPQDARLAPCLNNANCTHLPDNRGFTCSCAPGFSGRLCEKVDHRCSSNHCFNGGTCLFRDISTAMPHCECAHGWTGDRCQHDLNECTSVVDLCGPFNATCENLRGSFHCHCSMDRSGSRCQIPAVDGVPSSLVKNSLASDSLPSYFQWLFPMSLCLVLVILLLVLYYKGFHQKLMQHFFNHNQQPSAAAKVHFCSSKPGAICNSPSCSKFTRSPVYAMSRAPSLTESLYEQIDDKIPVSSASSLNVVVSNQTQAFGNIIYGTDEVLNEHNPLYSMNALADENDDVDGEELKIFIPIVHAQGTDV